MASVNRAIIIGRLGRDPEVRHTQSGQVVASFSVYSPLSRLLSATGEIAYAHLGASALSFSRRAVADFGIHKHETATLFFDGEPGNISRIIIHLGGHMLRITSPKKGALTRNISAHGLIKHLGMGALVGSRYKISELQHGYLEIDFRQKVDLAAAAEEEAA